MINDWKSYQEDVASVFRNLGCRVETNCECVGARTKHLLDVSVRISLFGLSQHWVVECKYWKNKRVSKDKVMTLPNQTVCTPEKSADPQLHGPEDLWP